MNHIDIEKIRLDALESVASSISDDVYGKMVKSLLDSSSKVTKEMLTSLLASLEESQK